MRRLFYLVLLLFMGGTLSLQAQIVIGSDKLPETFSALELVSTPSATGGLLLPKSSTAPASPVAGLMFFDTSNSSVKIYTGSSWITWNTPAATPTHAAATIKLPASGVTIGANTNPKPYAVLEVISATKGIRLPLINDTQCTALQPSLTAAAAGLMFFNTTTNKVNIWNGDAWIK